MSTTISRVDQQQRHKGRFITKRKSQWLQNVSTAAKRPRNREPPESTNTVAGRRVVNLQILADKMWCTLCDVPLSLKYIEEEKICGLASKMKVRCHICLGIHYIDTDSLHKTPDGKVRYSSNSKAAIGMIDAGIGLSQVATFLSALNIPPISDGLMKRHERVVGPVLETVAKSSCLRAVQLEKELTSTASKPQSPSKSTDERQSQPDSSAVDSTLLDTDNLGVTSLAASFDGAWQKKGAGRSYNSRTGHASLIGVHSKKILGYATRKKFCTKCERGHEAADHDCRANFSRSSKAMEPDMAVELIARNNTLKSENVIIGTLIGDGDSSSIAAVRRESTHQVTKWEDVNHASKSVSSHLYAIKGLSTESIKYLTRCFGFALKQNKGNIARTRKALLSIPKHVFNNHADCGDWCGYVKDPEKYIYKALTTNRGLSQDTLKTKLSELYARMANNAEGLAPCGSSQANESFNNTVASKHPKNRYYGGSESFDFRVAAAVAQKNSGTQYVVEVNKSIGASPGEHTKKNRSKKDAWREAESVKRSSKGYKARRRLLANEQNKQNYSAARKEGISYESACCIEGIGQLIECPREEVNASHVVIFDLETSGFGKNAEICQIAAIWEDQEFSVYIVPEKGISEKAGEVTGLHVKGGELFLRNTKVPTTPPHLAMRQFLQFLKAIGSRILLIAHNCFSFDAPQLLQQVTKLNLLEEFTAVVSGFADSLPLFRQQLIATKRPRNQFKQTDLARDFLDIVSEDAHNAVSDVRVLAQLITKFDISDEIVSQHAKTVVSISQAGARKSQIADIVKSLEVLRPEVSVGMVNRMAENGITLSLLTKLYTENGLKGVEMLFVEDVQGKPRISKQKKLLHNVGQKLSVLCDTCIK